MQALGRSEIEYARPLVEEPLPGAEDPLISLMRAWIEEDATDDPAELDARDREWDELKANLNAKRAAAQERLLFP